MEIMKDSVPGKVYKYDCKIELEKTPAGKDVALVKVTGNMDWANKIEPARLSKATLSWLIKQLKEAKKMMNSKKEIATK